MIFPRSPNVYRDKSSTHDAAGRWRHKLGGLLFLVTGAGLVVHIVVGIPLWLISSGGILLGAAVFAWLCIVTGVSFRRPLSIGLRAGVAATISYDLARLAAVYFLGLEAKPFEAWRFFGVALVGTDTSITLQWAVGSAFHFCNGLAFAVAYTYWFAPKGPLAGIGYAMMLEFFMLGLYPGWLKIADYAPFLMMSLIGHLVYGAVLGVLARRWWQASSHE